MKIKPLLILSVVILIAFNSCKKELKDEQAVRPNAKAIATTAYNDAKNPYSLASMRKAMASLLMKDVQLLANNKQQYSHGKIMSVGGNAALTINKSLTAKESITLAEKELVATHYYIKFMPANEADYAKLKADTNLIIYPFPLHTNSNQYGSNYRDPAVPANVPTYQYASVLVNYVLPNVPYVKLADLYLPDERSNAKPITIIGAGNSSYSVTGLALVNESLCDEEPVLPTYARVELPPEDCDEDYGGGGPGTGTGAPPGEWRPSGRITMIDDTHGTIGVEGIKVRARRWFTTYTGIADADGYYHVDGTFTRPANYWFDFERYDFEIGPFPGAGFDYYIDGPKIEGAWNYNITDTYNKYCANIFRAAFHYYYKDIQGLHRPPQNSFWAMQLKIKAIPEQGSSIVNPFFTFLNINDFVKIRNYDGKSYEVYSTTIHELAHAAHWDNSSQSFALSANTAAESWAAGVEWVLTKMVYPNYAGPPQESNSGYRNIVMDLIDDASQISYYDRNLYGGFYNNFGFGISKDQVQGYNIVDIQNAIINNPTTWNEWKNNIINNYNNGTEQHVEALFNHWLNY